MVCDTDTLDFDSNSKLSGRIVVLLSVLRTMRQPTVVDQRNTLI